MFFKKSQMSDINWKNKFKNYSKKDIKNVTKKIKK